jgi:tRNA pseudouridine-54 N-methylase
MELIFQHPRKINFIEVTALLLEAASAAERPVEKIIQTRRAVVFPRFILKILRANFPFEDTGKAKMALYHLLRITQRTSSQVKIKTQKIFLFGGHFSLFRKKSNLLAELKTFKILLSITILHRRHALSVTLPEESI